MEKETLNLKGKAILNESNITSIVRVRLNEDPISVMKITKGWYNDIFDIELPNRHIIIRLSKDEVRPRATAYFNSLFKSLNIPVQDILDVDLSRKLVPYPFVMLSKLDGDDLLTALPTMKDCEIALLAKAIYEITERIATIPARGFGEIRGNEPGKFASWQEAIQDYFIRFSQKSQEEHLVTDQELGEVKKLLRSSEVYFSQIRPTLFFDDLTLGNVIVQNGRLVGLIDLDCMTVGDPLLTLGLLKRMLIEYGYDFRYLEEWCRAARLNGLQYFIVDLYTMLFSLGFLSHCTGEDREKKHIDQEKIKRTHKILIDQVSFLKQRKFPKRF